jgi:hypothetical protein
MGRSPLPVWLWVHPRFGWTERSALPGKPPNGKAGSPGPGPCDPTRVRTAANEEAVAAPVSGDA